MPELTNTFSDTPDGRAAINAIALKALPAACTRCGHAQCRPQSVEVPICVHCEDRVACPVAVREREAQKRAGETKPPAAETTPPIEVMNDSAPETTPPQPEAAADEEIETMPTKTCKCGCGEPPMKGRDYKKGHKPKADQPSKIEREMSKAIREMEPEPEPPLARVHPDEAAVISVCLNELALNRWFANLSLEEKGHLFEQSFSIA